MCCVWFQGNRTAQTPSNPPGQASAVEGVDVLAEPQAMARASRISRWDHGRSSGVSRRKSKSSELQDFIPGARRCGRWRRRRSEASRSVPSIAPCIPFFAVVLCFFFLLTFITSFRVPFLPSEGQKSKNSLQDADRDEEEEQVPGRATPAKGLFLFGDGVKGFFLSTDASSVPSPLLSLQYKDAGMPIPKKSLLFNHNTSHKGGKQSQAAKRRQRPHGECVFFFFFFPFVPCASVHGSTVDSRQDFLTRCVQINRTSSRAVWV